MKILYVLNGFHLGGAEKGLLTLIKAGFFEGCELHVYALCLGDKNLSEQIRSSIGEDKFTCVSEVSNLTFNLTVRAFWGLLWKFYKLRPDVSVLSLKQANIIGRAALLLFPKIHCVSFEHTTKYRANRFLFFYQFFLWALSFRVNEIWADCGPTLSRMRKHFLPNGGRLEEVVPMYCSSTEDCVKRNYSITGAVRILVVGRLIASKRIDVVVDALTTLTRDGYDFRLTIFGDGPERRNLSGLVLKNGLANRVDFPGFVDNWWSYADQFDLFVNVSEVEGFCISVAEAMSAGLPVITSNVGGIQEYGVHEKNVIKLKTIDVGSLVNAIQRLVNSEKQRRQIAATARSAMSELYSSEALSALGSRVCAKWAVM